MRKMTLRAYVDLLRLEMYWDSIHSTSVLQRLPLKWALYIAYTVLWHVIGLVWGQHWWLTSYHLTELVSSAIAATFSLMAGFVCTSHIQLLQCLPLMFVHWHAMPTVCW